MKRKIIEHIANSFETYSIEVINHTPQTLAEDMKEPKKEESYIRDVLKKEMKLVPNNESKYFKIGCRIEQREAEENDGIYNYNKQITTSTGRFYSFLRQDYVETNKSSIALNEEEIEMIKKSYDKPIRDTLF